MTKSVCRRWLNIDSNKRGRIGEAVIFRGVFFSIPLFTVFPGGLRGGRWVRNVFSDRKYWLSMFSFFP